MGNIEDANRQEQTQEKAPEQEVQIDPNEVFTSAIYELAAMEQIIAAPPEISSLGEPFVKVSFVSETDVDTFIDNSVMFSPVSYLVREDGEVVQVLNTATLTPQLLERTTRSDGKIVDFTPPNPDAGRSTLSDLIHDNSPEGVIATKALIQGMLTAAGYNVDSSSIQYYTKERVIIAEASADERKLFVKLVEPGTGERELRGADRAGNELPAVSAEKLIRSSAYEALVQPYIDAIGHDRGIMSDLISHAELADREEVKQKLLGCVDEMYGAIHSWSVRTMEYGTGSANNDIFYHDRLAPDGRLNQYYEKAEFQLGATTITWDELLDKQWIIDGVTYKETLREIIDKAREDLNPHNTRILCGGHGDSTEMNLISNGLDVVQSSEPKDHVFGMIDLETVGTNDALGDGINHLVYLTVKGGFSVPKYYPEVLQDRPSVIEAYKRNTASEVDTAAAVHLDGDTISIESAPRLPISDTRVALATRFVERHLEPLLERIEVTKGLEVRNDMESRLGSYLMMRFIGVHNVSGWQPQDQLALFSTLIKSCATPDTDAPAPNALQRFLTAL